MSEFLNIYEPAVSVEQWKSSEVNGPQTLQKHHIIKQNAKTNKTFSTARGRSLNLDTKCFSLHKKGSWKQMQVSVEHCAIALLNLFKFYETTTRVLIFNLYRICVLHGRAITMP